MKLYIYSIFLEIFIQKHIVKDKRKGVYNTSNNVHKIIKLSKINAKILSDDK